MIAICEKCGEKYRINPSKIKGSSARFKCRACGNIVTVSKQEDEVSVPPPPARPASTPPDPSIPEARVKLDIKGLSIRSKITLIMVLLVIVSLAVAGFIASYQSRAALSGQAEDHLFKSAGQKSKEYGLTFERIKDEVLGIADYAGATYARKDINSDIGMSVLMPWIGGKYRYGSPALKTKLHSEKLIIQQIGMVLKSVVSKNPYLSLGYIGTETGMTVFDNEEVVKVIEKREAFDVTKRPWYLSVKESKSVIWTEPYVDANTMKLCITCAAPVLRPDKSLAAVVGFDVLLDTLQKDILALDIGYNSYAFLVNKKGSALVRPGMGAKGASWTAVVKTDNLLKTGNADFNNIISKMIKGRSGVDTYDAGDEGVKFIAYAPLKIVGASMGIVASKDEVIRPAVVIQNLIIIVFVVVLLISVLVGLFIGNNITKPINELTIMTNLISQGKRDLDVLKEDRKDEIGVLTRSFNRLVISLKLAMSR